MLIIDKNKEYLYTSKIRIKPSFFNYYDKTDPEIQVQEIHTQSINQATIIASKVFGDKYSARNWIFRILKTAFSNGASLDDLLQLSLYSPFVCYGHQVDKITANQFWNKFPTYAPGSPFIAGDSDMEFTMMSMRLITDEQNKHARKFQLDNLLDSSNYQYNEIITGPYVTEAKGPKTPPFEIDFGLDISEMEENIHNLTIDALDYKEYTIPPNSTVDLKSTSYGHVELIEEQNSVVFIFRSHKDYFTLGFDIQKAEWIDDYVVLNPEEGLEDETKTMFHKISIKYLAAIILHDFWVPEYIERNRSYNPERRRPQLNKYPWVKTDLDGRTNIYMPRIKYFLNERNQRPLVGSENIDSVKNGIFQNRTYGRSAHIRNLSTTQMKPNPEQVMLANEYGIRVPEYHTFVRPGSGNSETKKEEIEQKTRFYISRTAIKSLCNVKIFKENNSNIKWQKFEFDVMKYCKNQLGLIPLPRKIRKRGDGGIDILCMQKKKNKIIYWAIQCKCWSANRVIGIPILRELYASGLWADELTDEQKKNLRYMLITTSQFSTDPDFEKNASSNEVVLIDGNGFANKEIPVEFQ